MKDVTAEEKIAVVEELIEALRGAGARADQASPDNRRYHVLKAIAADLRGQLATAPEPALRSLSFQVDSAKRMKARIGYVDSGHHQAVSECLMSFWPVVRHALEQTEKQGEKR